MSGVSFGVMASGFGRGGGEVGGGRRGLASVLRQLRYSSRLPSALSSKNLLSPLLEWVSTQRNTSVEGRV